MSKFKLSEIINGYEMSDGKGFVGKRFFRREITGNITIRGGRRKKSKISAAADKISHILSYTNVRTYGFMLLSFGLLSIFAYFAYDFLTSYFSIIVENKISLTLGVISAIVSIPMLLIDGPISTVVQQYPITDTILFDFLCMKRMPPSEDETIHHPTLAIIAGILFALLGIYVSTAYVVLALLLLLYLCLSLMSPEFSLFITLLLLPYIPLGSSQGYAILALMILVTVVSFFRKLAFGKRVMYLEQYDMLLLLMLISVLCSGIFVSGISSFKWSIKYILLSIVYILTGNIITNRRLADRAVSVIAVSAVPPAIISMVTFFAEIGDVGFESLFLDGIPSVYSSVEAAASHFCICVILSLVMAVQSSGYAKAGYFTVAAVSALGLVLTFDPFAYIALALGIVAFLLMRHGRKSIVLVGALFALPYAVLLIFGEALGAWFGAFSDGVLPDGVLSLWQSVFDTFIENLIFGIGIGSDAFLSWLGYTGAVNSHNLFLELAAEAGAVALVALLAILLVRMRHRITYRRYLRHSDINLVSSAAGAAIIALLSIGAVSYIWQDLSVFYIFWCIFGIGSATLRIAKQENDDRVLYYQIDRDVDNFDVSVNLDPDKRSKAQRKDVRAK